MEVIRRLSIHELIASLNNEQLLTLIDVLKNEEAIEELLDVAECAAEEIREIA